MKHILVILGITCGAIFLLVTVFIIPQYFFSKTVVKPSPDTLYEAHIGLKRIPGSTLVQLFELYSTATVKIYDTARKKYIGSAITVSGKHCITKYGRKSELIQWINEDSLLVWCDDVHVVAKMGYDRDFTTTYIYQDRIIRVDIAGNTLVSYFVNPQSIYE